MRVWDVTMTCDHKMLVIAASAEAAFARARIEGRKHNAAPEGTPIEVDLDTAGLLCWYPGPWSLDAITEEK